MSVCGRETGSGKMRNGLYISLQVLLGLYCMAVHPPVQFKWQQAHFYVWHFRKKAIILFHTSWLLLLNPNFNTVLLQGLSLLSKTICHSQEVTGKSRNTGNDSLNAVPSAQPRKKPICRVPKILPTDSHSTPGKLLEGISFPPGCSLNVNSSCSTATLLPFTTKLIRARDHNPHFLGPFVICWTFKANLILKSSDSHAE